MAHNDRQAALQLVLIPSGQVVGSGAANEMAAGGNWGTPIRADNSRQKVVIKIMETLKKHVPYSGEEGLQELKKLAIRFEEKTYVAATSQPDYLGKICEKLFALEMKTLKYPIPDSPQSSASD